MSANQPITPVVPDPLGPQDLQTIKMHLELIRQGEMHALKAKQAGIDVTLQEQQLQEAKGKLMRLKNVYFPGQ